MMSVLLLGFAGDGRRTAGPGEAVRSLAALVPAAVNGVVRDLCVAGPNDRDLEKVADHAGCSYVVAADFRAALAAGARSTRAPHVLVTHAGTMMDRTLLDEIAALLPLLDPASGAAWAFWADSKTLAHRLLPALAPVAGLLCARSWLGTQKADSLAGLVRLAKHVRIMKSTAALAP